MSAAAQNTTLNIVCNHELAGRVSSMCISIFLAQAADDDPTSLPHYTNSAIDRRDMSSAEDKMGAVPAGVQMTELDEGDLAKTRARLRSSVGYTRRSSDWS